MKTIELTQGKVALVDDEDYEYLNQFNWQALKARHTWYAHRNGYNKDRHVKIYMHRDILKVPVGVNTDHKDGNGLNNQRCNIRIATNAQNQQNQINLAGGKSSCFKGVCWSKADNKWYVHITVKSRSVRLGSYISEIEAALVYDEAAKEYFGEFARLNFIEV